MPKTLQLFSDTHCEYFNGDITLLDPLINPGTNYLVIAGDFASLADLDWYIKCLNHLSPHYKHIVLVFGNHDHFYISVKEDLHRCRLELTSAVKNLTILYTDLGIVDLDGVKFFGDTCFYPEYPTTPRLSRGFIDHRLIKDFDPWVYENNTKYRKKFNSLPLNDVIVVNHHAPSWRSVLKRWINNESNIFFVNDLEKDIVAKQPKYILAGHMHEFINYYINKTEIIHNPFGYVTERGSNGFNPKLILDV